MEGKEAIMKPLPEIAPEIRGLLEEAVKDPRSSMRLVPRRALLSWFDKGETVGARDVSTTSLERHLIEAHREDLAQILYEAAVIGYWKTGSLHHRPLGADGGPFDPSSAELDWSRRAERRAEPRIRVNEGSELLQQCLNGIRPQAAYALAVTSLSLVASDKTRYCVAKLLPSDQPRAAIAALRRLSRPTQKEDLLLQVLHTLGSQLCFVGRYADAREAYRESASLDSGVIGRCYSFNLSCVLDEELEAAAEARELERLARPDDFRLIEAKNILRHWLQEVDPEVARRARNLAGRFARRETNSVLALCQAYEA